MIAVNRMTGCGVFAAMLFCLSTGEVRSQALDNPEAKPPKPVVKPTVPPLRAFPVPNRPTPVPGRTYPSAQRPVVQPRVRPAYPGTPSNALVWDKELKQITAPAGASNVLINFSFTNQHSSEVVIKNVRPSCGCTTVKLPSLPWRIPPGSNGQVTAKLDLRGKRGVLTKTLMVDSTSGFKSLVFKVTIPAKLLTTTVEGENIDADRLKNMQLAMVDRQVIFKNPNCVECHLTPAIGRMGEELYHAACAICHDTPTRATMVPDLKNLKYPTSAPYWKYWINNGRPGSLMPGFHKNLGGPLDNEQIQSLVDYLTENITRKKQAQRTNPIKPTVRTPPVIRAPVKALNQPAKPN